jgi:methylmalonyl-CoA mutase
MEKASDTPILSLADGFEAAGREEWTALVEKALKGRPIDKALRKSTYEGVTLDALYRPEDVGEPARRRVASFARNSTGWDIRQLHARPEPAGVNADIKTDLAGGASSVTLRLDGGARRGGGMPDIDGLVMRRAVDLDAALAGVDLARTALILEPGAAFLPVAAAYVSVAGGRGVKPGQLSGSFGADPLGALAENGALPGPLDASLDAMAALAGWTSRNAPGLRAVWINTSLHHDAGATETQDLAYAMATALAYLRAMTGAGMSIDDAVRQIGFTLSVGTEVFQVIAKLRAARRLWARIVEACGGDAGTGAMALGAVTASRELSRRDVWVNQLRATCACFAAGVGGAVSITVHAHTDAIGAPEALARRVARNIQTILVRESSLARVADPAGGSYYVERLSDEYARRAWAILQEIEAGGGMAEALVSGRIADQITAAWAERERNLARRRDERTGVSSFPDLDEAPSPVAQPDTESLRRIAEAARAGDQVPVPGMPDIDGMIDAASKGASLAALLKPLSGTPAAAQPLVRHRLGEAFEALRDASDARLAKTGKRPAAFLAEIGTPADYTARAVFTKSYLAAGGIAAREAAVGRASVAAAFRDSGADLAVICSSDTLYETEAEALALALKQAGAGPVLLAGRPGDREAAYRASGIDRFIHAGDDMLASLKSIAGEIGMIEP